ncbi:MAG: polyphosphate kinase 2, partial [Nocardia sp.]|nr:polyphosphate kinase 2 [Nocardia sp.]
MTDFATPQQLAPDLSEVADLETAVDLTDTAGFTVEDNDDDDPMLLKHLDRAFHVDTWREGYPYDERLHRHRYEIDKRLLQIELLKLQNWIKSTGQRLVIVFEGRD